MSDIFFDLCDIGGPLERDEYEYIPPKRSHKLFKREKGKRVKLKC